MNKLKIFDCLINYFFNLVHSSWYQYLQSDFEFFIGLVLFLLIPPYIIYALLDPQIHGQQIVLKNIIHIKFHLLDYIKKIRSNISDKN
jgi:hypothetical protein